MKTAQIDVVPEIDDTFKDEVPEVPEPVGVRRRALKKQKHWIGDAYGGCTDQCCGPLGYGDLEECPWVTEDEPEVKPEGTVMGNYMYEMPKKIPRARVEKSREPDETGLQTEPRGREIIVKFDLAADLIEADDYEKLVEWKRQMDKRPSSGSATMLMKTAEVQDQDQDRREQHPKSKRYDSKESVVHETSEQRSEEIRQQTMWSNAPQSLAPGAGIDIPQNPAEEAAKKEKLDKQNRCVEKLGRALQAVSFLKTLGGTLSMTKESDAWQQLIITVDSGASESVAPGSAATNVPVEESLGSRSGVTYEVANGEIIDNQGQKNCVIKARGGSTEQLLAFQVCEVHKPLLSVSKLLSVGKAVVFHPDWSYIEDLVTGEKIDLVQKDGLFELHCWVRPEQSFRRQGR